MAALTALKPFEHIYQDLGQTLIIKLTPVHPQFQIQILQTSKLTNKLDANLTISLVVFLLYIFWHHQICAWFLVWKMIKMKQVVIAMGGIRRRFDIGDLILILFVPLRLLAVLSDRPILSNKIILCCLWICICVFVNLYFCICICVFAYLCEEYLIL